MRQYRMMVMSRPHEGREEEYNDWYQNVHLRELVALPGIKSARRYRQARKVSGEGVHPYLAVYEIETDDIDAVLQGLYSAASGGQITMIDAIDTATSVAVVYEEFGPPVNAP